MKQVSLFIGLNKKGTNVQTIPTLEALRITENVIATYTDGATIRECRGFYTCENGVKTHETTLEAIFFEPDMKAIASICSTLKNVLDQEAIYANVTNVETIEF